MATPPVNPEGRLRDEAGRYVSKLTPAIQAEIVKALEAGAPPEAAASYAGIWRSTFLNWMRWGKEAIQAANGDGETIFETDAYARFVFEVEHAQARFLVANQLSISAIGRGQREGAWQALAWQLERRFPAWFSRKLRHEVTGRDGGPIEHAIVLDPDALERLPLEDLRELERIMAKIGGEVIDQEPLAIEP